jgi:chorismate lyase/3-hydroxybenzoate synthase
MSSARAIGETTELLSVSEPVPPRWVEDWVADAGPAETPEGVELPNVSVRRGQRFSLTKVVIPAVDSMDILTLQQSVADAYRAVFDAARASQRHPVRLWAFIPRIHADHGNGLDRYMVFNAGRFAACTASLGGRDALSHSIPTASGVGCQGSDLHLFCLTSVVPGTPVENPRQVPAYRYSKRFGPLPPCFARATLLRYRAGEPELLLVGGTASIRGEESMHLSLLEEQLQETLENLKSLVRSAAQLRSEKRADGVADAGLRGFRELRAYYRDPAHRDALLAGLQEAFPSLRRLEVRHAELCRRELLVEIEGLAEP